MFRERIRRPRGWGVDEGIDQETTVGGYPRGLPDAIIG